MIFVCMILLDFEDLGLRTRFREKAFGPHKSQQADWLMYHLCTCIYAWIYLCMYSGMFDLYRPGGVNSNSTSFRRSY